MSYFAFSNKQSKPILLKTDDTTNNNTNYLRSDNNGLSWYVTTYGTMTGGGSIGDIVEDKNPGAAAGRYYATTVGGRVLLSTNYGVTWTQIKIGSQVNPRSMAIYGTNITYTSDDPFGTGLYQLHTSTNSGTSWLNYTVTGLAPNGVIFNNMTSSNTSIEVGGAAVYGTSTNFWVTAGGSIAQPANYTGNNPVYHYGDPRSSLISLKTAGFGRYITRKGGTGTAVAPASPWSWGSFRMTDTGQWVTARNTSGSNMVFAISTNQNCTAWSYSSPFGALHSYSTPKAMNINGVFYVVGTGITTGQQSGIYRSTDGANFTLVYSGSTFAKTTQCDPIVLPPIGG